VHAEQAFVSTHGQLDQALLLGTAENGCVLVIVTMMGEFMTCVPNGTGRVREGFERVPRCAPRGSYFVSREDLQQARCAHQGAELAAMHIRRGGTAERSQPD